MPKRSAVMVVFKDIATPTGPSFVSPLVPPPKDEMRQFGFLARFTAVGLWLLAWWPVRAIRRHLRDI